MFLFLLYLKNVQKNIKYWLKVKYKTKQTIAKIKNKKHFISPPDNVSKITY